MQHLQTYQRFIIERPRLIGLLDSLTARIILITAPAGYGKTTLARQWAAGRHDVLWYDASSASRDVAALLVDLARACLLPDEDRANLRAQIESIARPDVHAESLALAFAEALASCQRHGIVAVDDVDLVDSTHGSADFLQRLIEASPLRFLIIGRQRPGWASARRILYGEIAELDRAALAFTSDEATELLAETPRARTDSLWHQARGWPAILRLAALTGSRAAPVDAFGSALHEYFAEELYDAASSALRSQLPYLALLPNLTQQTLHLVFGGAQEELQQEAIETGFLSALSDGRLELHPLLRGFLTDKIAAPLSAERCHELITDLISLHEWDNALSVIKGAKRADILPQLISASLDDLLNQGRLRTLDDWMSFARSESLSGPDVQLLEAELARRSGLLTVARSQALSAAEAYEFENNQRASRCWALGGICAHLSQDFEDAIFCFRNARWTARTKPDMREAIWGEFVTRYAREEAAMPQLLHEYEQFIDGDAGARVRYATGCFIVARWKGALEQAIRDSVAPYLDLCSIVSDPLITSSLYYQLGYGYSLIGRYSRALEVVARGEEQMRTQHLSFALTHFAAARIAATIGLRRFRRADTLIDSLLQLAESSADTYEIPNGHALRARLLLSTGDSDEAARELTSWESTPVNALRAELAALRALALAHGPATHGADDLAATALAMSSDAQPQTAARAALAIIDLRSGTSDDAQLEAFEDVLVEREDYDGLVLAYRSYPPLLKHLVTRGRVSRRRIFELISDAHDKDVALAAGVSLPRHAVTTSRLSQREQEVFDLIQQGYMNKEIAAALFISPSTVKVHVRHIFEKLGVKTRTQAVSKYRDS